jgi:hypothetical protein
MRRLKRMLPVTRISPPPRTDPVGHRGHRPHADERAGTDR